MFTTSTPTPTSRRRLAMARVSAGTRVQAERLAAEKRQQSSWDAVRVTGQLVTENEEWCFICGRATDHTGEHTPEQITNWKMDNATGRMLERSSM